MIEFSYPTGSDQAVHVLGLLTHRAGSISEE